MDHAARKLLSRTIMISLYRSNPTNLRNYLSAYSDGCSIPCPGCEDLPDFVYSYQPIQLSLMKTFIATALFFHLFLLTSCKKSSSESPSAPNPTTPTHADKLALIQELKPEPEVFQTGPEGKTIFSTKDYIQIEMPYYGITDVNGQVYIRDYDIQVVPMLTMKDMILNHSQTVGPDGIFVSGGQISIRAFDHITQSEIKLSTTSKLPFILFPQKLPIGTLTYPVWYATQNSDSLPVQWVPSDSIPGNMTQTRNSRRIIGLDNGIQPADSAYEGPVGQGFYIKKFTTINLDYYYNEALPRTKIHIQVPAGYSNNNTICYLAFPEINSVAMLYGFDSTSNTFELGGYEIPIGLSAKAVIISKQDSQYSIGIQPFTVTENKVVQTTPSPSTRDAIKTALDQL
jgi:hypothetical protein